MPFETVKFFFVEPMTAKSYLIKNKCIVPFFREKIVGRIKHFQSRWTQSSTNTRYVTSPIKFFVKFESFQTSLELSIIIFWQKPTFSTIFFLTIHFSYAILIYFTKALLSVIVQNCTKKELFINKYFFLEIELNEIFATEKEREKKYY